MARRLELVRKAQHRARAAERLAEIGSMTGGLAHEIKNPLSTIGLNAQLLAEAIDELPVADEERSRLTRRVGSLTREAERLRGILTDFLDFAGEKRLDPREVDLNDIVDELVDFFHPQAEKDDVRLRTQLWPSPVLAAVDASLLKQALLNLMLNATQALGARGQASQPGDGSGRPRELLLRIEASDGNAHIRVADTGPGIPPDAMQDIFRPYFTTKAAGTGLGLPTTRRIIEEHGGGIEVHSDPDRGTEFVITLPLAGQEQASEPASV